MRIYGGKTMRVKDIIRFVNDGKFSFSDYVRVVNSDGLGFVQDCLGDSKGAIKMIRTVFVIAKGSVMHV